MAETRNLETVATEAGSPEPVMSATIASQHRASHPGNSAWVSANAGSGKTYVLAQRVIRLLLHNVPPTRILCLTFTKAAAAEMSNRVFSLLGKWSSMDDEELIRELREAGEPNPPPAMLEIARVLFTRALESPGGLKIQTIHAFCESLLHQFTLEANTSGHFEVMADHDQASMLEEARKSVFSDTLRDKSLSAALALAMEFASDHAIEQGLNAIIHDRQNFEKWIFRNENSAGLAIDNLADQLNVDRTISDEDHATELLAQLPLDDARFHEVGIIASQIDAKECLRIVDTVKAYEAASSSSCKLDIRISLYQTKSGEFRKSIPGVKKLYEKISDLDRILEQELDQIQSILDQIRTRKILEGSLGLFTLGNAVLQAYGKQKRARGLLDFDDLVHRAAELLARSDVRQWVQYKLDQGIDHVLVDEAQDTSAVQWEIINAIIEEFFAGQTARQVQRTVFAVGDQKQSIYSFQGAEPEQFSSQKLVLGKKAKFASLPFEDIHLPVSFRSTRDVLSAVDMVFSNPANARGLQAEDDAIIHEPVRISDPGEVEIWPMIEHQKTDAPKDWLLPIDHIADEHPTLSLARQISSTIQGWITDGEFLPGKGRKITHGDILILVRKRDRFASAITRELKQAGLSVAGADRLNLANHIAIEDLLSLGKWTLFPEDDLSLAEILKCPLFEFSEEELFDLCYPRENRNLWQQLTRTTEETYNPKVQDIRQQLARLIDLSSRVAPFEFYSEILSSGNGRKKFKARLGDEVDDVLDAFMLEALNHTNNGGTGLQEFIQNLEESAPDIKRELDLEKDEIRVMTVHSSKGLEAPIVFLVDPGSPAFSSNHKPAILKIEEPPFPDAYIWQPGKDNATELTRKSMELVKQKAEEEYRRLLYVAMTRAEDRLILCGYANRNTKNANTWHQMVSTSLIDHCNEIREGENITAWRWIKEHPRRKAKPQNEIPEPEEAPVSQVPDWATAKLAPPRKYIPPLQPSTASLNVEAPEREQDSNQPPTVQDPGSMALERGNATHHLLQFLPASDSNQRRELAQNYLSKSLAHRSEEQQSGIIDEVMAILEHKEYRHLFSENSQAEVSLTGKLAGKRLDRTINAQIDRLAILDDRIDLVDYKTDRTIPAVPENISSTYLVQLAIYQNLIRQIYPHKPVRCHILWTGAPRLMEIPDEILREALQNYLEKI